MLCSWKLGIVHVAMFCWRAQWRTWVVDLTHQRTTTVNDEFRPLVASEIYTELMRHSAPHDVLLLLDGTCGGVESIHDYALPCGSLVVENTLHTMYTWQFTAKTSVAARGVSHWSQEVVQNQDTQHTRGSRSPQNARMPKQLLHCKWRARTTMDHTNI